MGDWNVNIFLCGDIIKKKKKNINKNITIKKKKNEKINKLCTDIYK